MSAVHPIFEDIFKGFGVQPEPVEMQNYRVALKCHDWEHEFSDDHSVWAKGNASLQRIKTMASYLDPDFKIWNAVAPESHRRNV
jgi:hypothetical protein